MSQTTNLVLGMMGNEGSQLSGLEIDEKIVEVTDGWTLHSGTVCASHNTNVNVFISDVFVGSGGNAAILERAAKNLMLYRHPCILKFISSWKKSGRIHLATEEAKPLASVISSLIPLQICIGLHSVLKALVFLHETALCSHNNVCCAAIYVSTDGTWKLGGLEHLCLFTDLTTSYLEGTRARRYEKAIPPEEDSLKSSNYTISHPTSIDQYGFGVFAEEMLCNKFDSDVPALEEFLGICKKHLQNLEPSLRPKLASLLDHVCFKHKFIKIHSFLVELPLKTEVEKNNFFRSLMDELTGFPENLVAMQLGALLLSRMVLLDATAQEILLPCVLGPKQNMENRGNVGLFSLTTYRDYVVPRLLQMFCVRDAQIRLLLLAHFSSFCHSFTEDQLRTLVLPELLVGIKDTNEQLVSVTLHALADLIPLLGASAVIGGKRAKLFTDGRPKACHNGPYNLRTPKSHSKVLPTPAPAPVVDTDGNSFAADLPERPSPDGGEDHMPTSHDETESWPDWDVPDNTVDTLVDFDAAGPSRIQDCSKVAAPSTMQELPDISQLDIRNSVSSLKGEDEFDFFQDMEPVILKTCTLQIDEQGAGSSDAIEKSGKHIFNVNYTSYDGEEGWGDDLEEWGDVNST
ncbi:protein-associating with the carboxyl-terminal domain of ezrin isoform X2 [Zootermopsis nevadensis]|uniref:protein-associating with the carboxyl-terminal domain of ezrin isoform X2 n=1 Tax=Zootermopsis nevadensis TaxID=136037 RepID=UPI000B8E6CE1|nr:protein-associating with the carboxyl-terminal domain of ezrin isoform X2 [Zootermopsis nevadensis]